MQKNAQDGAIKLLPIGVIEAHGPHMCLGVDTYLSYTLCRLIKHKLEEKGIKALIAPPFYRGICNIMNDNFGSIGIFPSDSSVVFLSPVYSEELFQIHKDLYMFLSNERYSFDKHYMKGSWIPHCTPASRLFPDEAEKALNYFIKNFKDMNATVDRIGIIEGNPVNELSEYKLNSIL